jgi:hypothetical protein
MTLSLATVATGGFIVLLIILSVYLVYKIVKLIRTVQNNRAAAAHRTAAIRLNQRDHLANRPRVSRPDLLPPGEQFYSINI